MLAHSDKVFTVKFDTPFATLFSACDVESHACTDLPVSLFAVLDTTIQTETVE